MIPRRTAIRGLLALACIAPAAAAASAPAATPSSAPQVTAAVNAPGLLGWTPAAVVHGRTAVWLRRVAADAGSAPGATVTLLRFDQHVLRLQLHAGSVDPGGSWRHGPQVTAPEIHTLVAAFNGGFKFSYAAAGFELDGRVVRAPLHGLASVVTYADGRTDIGAWGVDVPSGRSAVVDVRQNLVLLVNRRTVAANVSTCVLACWGDTVASVLDSARSGLGITASGQLVWAGGEQLSVAALGAGLVAAGAVRALELDINPFWVASYIYGHRGTPAAYPMVLGQLGIAGQLIRGPDPRDFFTLDAR
jgi:hypothetical protein